MPPVTKAGGTQFRKDIEFVTKDDDEQIAAGIVMVPDKADLQNDFVREDTIKQFADQFETFEAAGEASGGIMHAVWPDGWMELERNEVLESAQEIGGTEAPAGAWVQEWRVNNADLWELVQDSIIEGYSIGAIQVDWNGPYEQGEVDNVTVPDKLGDDAQIWELTSGLIQEVSAVDIPAVPDAMILETKANADKRLGDHLGNRDGFMEEAVQRGHSEEEAERLWNVLNAALDVEGSSEPGKQSSMFTRVGKAVMDAITGSSDGEGEDGESGKNASDGDTSDDTTTMSESDKSELKELAEENQAQISELTDAVKNLTDTVAASSGEETVELEFADGTREVPKSQVEDALAAKEDDEDEDDEDDDEDEGKAADADLESLQSDVKALNDRLNTISQQSGLGSDQLKSTGDGDEEDDPLSGLGKALS
ncbi:Putative phage serine protease XkdF [Haladaptatus litoreus]|uniref:Putative phage serine protease XkdF n=1 Tax=Haladaptatus litoreus TaxID=553468 RepID=A0A1N7FJ14_9EURY|nr:XkdF-like putative serine protease domain-containing protein [Haladaptatus litoreus]SIS00280.1 Putative phage serine protease XkdF [Haladaptatus litoreus]